MRNPELRRAFSAHAQYTIDWHKIAGGGGTTTNTQYALTGTIGQHDAGTTLTNAQFTVLGDFWVLPQAIQGEGAPTLSITPAGPGYATISWNTAGYALQKTWSLSPPNWTNSPTSSTNPITLPAIDAAKFDL
jgi:hypothetical protein